MTQEKKQLVYTFWLQFLFKFCMRSKRKIELLVKRKEDEFTFLDFVFRFVCGEAVVEVVVVVVVGEG